MELEEAPDVARSARLGSDAQVADLRASVRAAAEDFFWSACRECRAAIRAR